MKIRIEKKNEEKINSEIKNIEGRARARTLDFEDLEDLVQEIESRLKSKLYKKDWPGLVFECNPEARTFPSSYSGIPSSTQAVIEAGHHGAWFLTKVERKACGGPASYIKPLNLHVLRNKLGDFAVENF